MQRDIQARYYREYAEATVLCELIDALLQEDICALSSRGMLSEATLSPQLALESGEMLFQVKLNDARSLFWRVRAAVLQSYRLSRLPVVLVTCAAGERQTHALGARELFGLLTSSIPLEELTRFPGCERFSEELDLAVVQTALSCQAKEELVNDAPTNVLGALERLAALRDRPFHPTARAKYGWNVEEYSRYGAEFGHPLAVDWLAVRRDYLRTGAGATGEGIAPFVLSQEECGLLDEAMRNAALTSEQYLPLPVHPWQMQHVLPTLFEREWQEGICVPLHRNLGSFVATSSVRTLMPVAGCAGHLKLALGIHALGALRTLPARYMENGQKAQTLLQAVIERDSLLRERLLFCQEDAWWAFFDPEGDPFDGRYGQLACLLRRYPGELFAADTLPIPMSALTVTEPYILFARLLRERGADPADAAQALVLLREICDLFILVSLTCACYGLLPEMHGQNVLLLARQGRITQLVLRDHDTVRIHLPWLHEAELPDPEYTVKPNTRNTLILHTPEALLSYFQTLGMQVNLYALVRTLEVAYGVDELHGWRVIEDSLRQTLADISCPTAKKGLFTRTLLDAATWPTKCLVRPLLQRATVGDEGMPSSTGVTVNPFHKAGALRRDFSWENL